VNALGWLCVIDFFDANAYTRQMRVDLIGVNAGFGYMYLSGG
jgi:hypothetical protein